MITTPGETLPTVMTVADIDGLGRLTKIEKETNQYPDKQISTHYHYDLLGRIDQVTDPLGRVTRYTYDGLNRVTEVLFPVQDGEPVQKVVLSYDDPTNTVTVTDEEGGQVIEKSDWANRLAEAKQLCAFKGTTTTYSWSFVYDSFGKKLRQQDPLANQSDYCFDGFGRLTQKELPAAWLVRPGATEPEEFRPGLPADGDRSGRQHHPLSV